jgi:hypothetical protein
VRGRFFSVALLLLFVIVVAGTMVISTEIINLKTGLRIFKECE